MIDTRTHQINTEKASSVQKGRHPQFESRVSESKQAFNNEDEFRKQVHQARMLVSTFVLLSVIYSQELDNLVNSLWSWLRLQFWFKHDSFEPIWATFCFTLWINLFFLIDWLGQPYAQKYLINPVGRKPWEVYDEKFHRYAGFFYLVPLLVFDYFNPRRTLPESGLSFFEMIFGVGAAIFLYDLIFYPVHYLMHKVPWLYKNFHSTHHTVSPLVSEEIIRHSLVDGTLQVAANILALNILRLHPLSRLLYNFIITYLLTESHAGYDMPWMLHNIAGVLLTVFIFHSLVTFKIFSTWKNFGRTKSSRNAP